MIDSLVKQALSRNERGEGLHPPSRLSLLTPQSHALLARLSVSSNRMAHLSQAASHLEKGEYGEAVKCFQRAVDITPAVALKLIQVS